MDIFLSLSLLAFPCVKCSVSICSHCKIIITASFLIFCSYHFTSSSQYIMLSPFLTISSTNIIYRSSESAQPLVKVLPFEFSVSMIEQAQNERDKAYQYTNVKNTSVTKIFAQVILDDVNNTMHFQWKLVSSPLTTAKFQQ